MYEDVNMNMGEEWRRKKKWENDEKGSWLRLASFSFYLSFI